MNPETSNLARAFQRTADCLTIDDLIMALEGADPELKRQTEAHLETCANCRTELALFRGFESAPVRPDEQRDVNSIVARLRKSSPVAREAWWKSIWKPRLLMPVAIATAAAMMIIAVGIRHQSSDTLMPGDEQVMRSRQIAVVSPAGDLTQPARSLEWGAVPGARSYRVSILEVDRTPLWTATVQQTHSAVPKDVMQRMAPLKTLLWKVEALDETGSVFSESQLTRFRVTPR